jgi:hypothetical protein
MLPDLASITVKHLCWLLLVTAVMTCTRTNCDLHLCSNASCCTHVPPCTMLRLGQPPYIAVDNTSTSSPVASLPATAVVCSPTARHSTRIYAPNSIQRVVSDSCCCILMSCTSHWPCALSRASAAAAILARISSLPGAGAAALLEAAAPPTFWPVPVLADALSFSLQASSRDIRRNGVGVDRCTYHVRHTSCRICNFCWSPSKQGIQLSTKAAPPAKPLACWGLICGTWTFCNTSCIAAGLCQYTTAHAIAITAPTVLDIS